MDDRFVIGVDFGSDSVRALVVNALTGENMASAVAFYPRWKAGLYQHPEQAIFRQHPLDYLESIEKCIKEAAQSLSAQQRANIVGIGIDTTGSTPVPVDRNGTPLALLEEFKENENAMFHLWKDHSAFAEADEINALFVDANGVDYTQFQGNYSAEWYWAKILHAVRTDQAVREAAYTWEEHSDWMVGELCGKTRPEEIFHGACAAGHKAYWHSAWKGLPDKETLAKLDPYLVQVAEHYGNAPQPAFVKVGTITKEWAERLGLPETTAIAGSSFDAHAGAVGAGIAEKTMVCTMGTSAVDMIVAKPEELAGKDLKRFCGQAENSILPDFVGVETGQAAFGDIFAWFKKLLMWPLKILSKDLADEQLIAVEQLYDDRILVELQKEAEKLPDEPFPIALDWFNGRRYPDTDDFQKAAISGLRLGMSAPYIYRSLVFGAVCGVHRIVEGFCSQGVAIEKVIAVGGISKKSTFVMQMMADVLDKRIAIVDADQTCALGAATYAAVAGGVYDSASASVSALAAKQIREFIPDAERHAFYMEQYAKYLELAHAIPVR